MEKASNRIGIRVTFRNYPEWTSLYRFDGWGDTYNNANVPSNDLRPNTVTKASGLSFAHTICARRLAPFTLKFKISPIDREILPYILIHNPLSEIFIVRASRTWPLFGKIKEISFFMRVPPLLFLPCKPLKRIPQYGHGLKASTADS
jgi:hypothetical protein